MQTTTKRIVLLTSVALAAACAGAIARPLIIPPAAAADTQRWEHLCIVVDRKEATESLNRAGAEGWELETAMPYWNAEYQYCLKRPRG
jgi:hypothetical protein